ncbi:unnamed protein product [Rhizoctonia solani]|uniref:Uncharacterized protein n=1 Tax=Rhizoctonia solani TaxID=456999 RepID=A0A8H3CTF5_9AGAM|nr:unnamed protein product [Rhizoctonia solani]
MSLTILHPIWGRDIGQYYGSYTFLAFKQELHSNIISATQRANFVPMNKGMHAIRIICQIGKEENEIKINSMARDVSLQILRDALDMSWYKLLLKFLAEPEIIRGCIKLMGTVIPDGESSASPFSYEYGYLCFRIATISFGLCLVENSLDSAFKAAVLDLRSGRLHPLEVVAEVIADSVKRIVQSSPTIKNGHKMDERALMVPTRDVTKLMNLIWDNRDLFIRVVSHTYTPGMVGLMYIFWQLWRISRCRESSDGDQRLGAPLYELLRRYNLGVTSDQDVALSSLLSDTRFLRDTWLGHSELTDAKDSKALMHGYIHRISTSDTWHYKPHIFSIAPILEFVIRFAQPGAQNVFPLLFSATTRFLWSEIEGKQQIAENDIPGIISILHCFLKLFEILPDAAHCAMQNLIHDIVNSDLVGLIARLIVLRRPTTDKSDNERGMNSLIRKKPPGS